MWPPPGHPPGLLFSHPTEFLQHALEVGTLATSCLATKTMATSLPGIDCAGLPNVFHLVQRVGPFDGPPLGHVVIHGALTRGGDVVKEASVNAPPSLRKQVSVRCLHVRLQEAVEMVRSWQCPPMYRMQLMVASGIFARAALRVTCGEVVCEAPVFVGQRGGWLQRHFPWQLQK